MTGRIIVLEGLDGCGKTTAAWSLAQALDARWLTTPGEELRAVRTDFEAAFSHCAVARSLAYGAAVIEVGVRAQEWVALGRDVVVDRYWLSTLVYAPDAAQPALAALEPLVAVPDLTLYLQAPLELRRQRLARRPLSSHDADTLDPAEDRRLDDRYCARAGHPLAGAWQAVDAAGGPDRVLARLLERVEARPGPHPPCRALA